MNLKSNGSLLKFASVALWVLVLYCGFVGMGWIELAGDTEYICTEILGMAAPDSVYDLIGSPLYDAYHTVSKLRMSLAYPHLIQALLSFVTALIITLMRLDAWISKGKICGCRILGIIYLVISLIILLLNLENLEFLTYLDLIAYFAPFLLGSIIIAGSFLVQPDNGISQCNSNTVKKTTNTWECPSCYTKNPKAVTICQNCGFHY